MGELEGVWVEDERRKFCGVKESGGRCVGGRREESGVLGEVETVKMCEPRGEGEGVFGEGIGGRCLG